MGARPIWRRAVLEAEALLAMVSIALGLLAVRKLKAAGHLEREPVPALTR